MMRYDGGDGVQWARTCTFVSDLSLDSGSAIYIGQVPSPLQETTVPMLNEENNYT